MMQRSVATRTVALVLALTLLTLLGAPAAHARTQGTRWVTKQLLWNGTTKQKTFTASVDDTAFIQLPADIDWSAIDVTATLNAQAHLFFVVKGAVAANADTVQYVYQRGAGGAYSYQQVRDFTANITTTAIRYNGSPGGVVFTSVIQTQPNLRQTHTVFPTQNLRIKVFGDANAALNSLECWITYPATAPVSNPTRWVTVPLKWNNGSYSRTFAASQADSAFLVLPSDIDWSCVDVLVTTNATLFLDFTRTTAASGADTVRYLYQPGLGGTFAHADFRDQTPGLTNTAVCIGATGSVFSGYLQTNPNARSTVAVTPPCQTARIKVQGDPDGILTGVTAYLTYPQQR